MERCGVLNVYNADVAKNPASERLLTEYCTIDVGLTSYRVAVCIVGRCCDRERVTFVVSETLGAKEMNVLLC